MAKDEAAEIEIASTGALRIVQEAVRPDCSVHELAELAAADPGFALRALSMVNSSAFGLRSQVSDVRHAASLLGVRGLRHIAEPGGG